MNKEICIIVALKGISTKGDAPIVERGCKIVYETDGWRSGPRSLETDTKE